MSILVKNGHLITAGEDYVADILVDDGKIKATGTDLTTSADRTINATGKYVIPGGIDPHTHLDLPLAGWVSADDFYTGTVAAACGGTTTIVDFAVQSKGRPLLETLETWHKKAEGKAVIDYGFHMAVIDLPDELIPELDEVVRQGVTSFKMFMAYPAFAMVTDDVIFKTMGSSVNNGALLSLHAEHGHMIEVLIKAHLAQGHTAPKYHAITRPPVSEAEAAHRAISMASVAGAPLYFVHLSSADALQEVREARPKQKYLYAETCPHYLTLDESLYDQEGFEGAKYVLTPPLREKRHQDELWNGLRLDDIQVVSTDHCSWRFDDQKILGKDDFSKIPNGGPSIENRLSILYTKGVLEGRIDMNRLVEVFATNAAKRFGLFPRKGSLAAGSDADLVIFDPARESTISVKTHHMNMDYSMYEGWKVKGVPEVVIANGKVIVDDGEFVGKAGDGRFLKRDTQP